MNSQGRQLICQQGEENVHSRSGGDLAVCVTLMLLNTEESRQV